MYSPRPKPWRAITTRLRNAIVVGIAHGEARAFRQIEETRQNGGTALVERCLDLLPSRPETRRASDGAGSDGRSARSSLRPRLARDERALRSIPQR